MASQPVYLFAPETDKQHYQTIIVLDKPLTDRYLAIVSVITSWLSKGRDWPTAGARSCLERATVTRTRPVCAGRYGRLRVRPMPQLANATRLRRWLRACHAPQPLH